MKKALLIFLACLLMTGLFGCASQTEETPNTDTLPSDTVESESETEETPVRENTTVRICSSAENVLCFGERESANESYLECSNPGSGFEMKLQTEGGTVGIRITASESCDFRIWLDGTEQTSADGSAYFTVLGNRLIELTDVADGAHTLRVIRISETAADVKIYAVTFLGEQLALDTTGRLFVEFLGDGMTAGESLGDGRDDITKAYSYLAADLFGADRAITGYRNAGIAKTLDLYGTAGDFSRRADMVVLNIGAYDLGNGVDAGTFAEKYGELLISIKKLNGSQCKIVCVINFANAEYAQAVRDACERIGGETYGYYCYESGLQTDGSLTPDQHEALAEGVAAYLSEIETAVVEDMMLKSEESGTGDNIGLKSDEWETLN